jgi:hypothetical protein
MWQTCNNAWISGVTTVHNAYMERKGRFQCIMHLGNRNATFFTFKMVYRGPNNQLSALWRLCPFRVGYINVSMQHTQGKDILGMPNYSPWFLMFPCFYPQFGTMSPWIMSFKFILVNNICCEIFSCYCI